MGTIEAKRLDNDGVSRSSYTVVKSVYKSTKRNDCQDGYPYCDVLAKNYSGTKRKKHAKILNSAY